MHTLGKCHSRGSQQQRQSKRGDAHQYQRAVGAGPSQVLGDTVVGEMAYCTAVALLPLAPRPPISRFLDLVISCPLDD